MISALEAIAYMSTTWTKLTKDTELEEEDKYPGLLILGVEYCLRMTVGDLKQATTLAGKIGYFRSLFGLWKAVCVRLEKQKYYQSGYDARKAFTYYMESSYPELYTALVRANVFLGIAFTEDDKARIRTIERRISSPLMMGSLGDCDAGTNAAIQRRVFGRVLP